MREEEWRTESRNSKMTWHFSSSCLLPALPRPLLLLFCPFLLISSASSAVQASFHIYIICWTASALNCVVEIMWVRFIWCCKAKLTVPSLATVLPQRYVILIAQTFTVTAAQLGEMCGVGFRRLRNRILPNMREICRSVQIKSTLNQPNPNKNM